MLQHSAAHWKSGVDSSLWPMAVTYAIHVYNDTPNARNLCRADLCTGSTVPSHRLRDLHTWGCHVHILDPSLQAGKKLPWWEPQSHRGVFIGLSTFHSSEAPLILNTTTWSNTLQYHMVIDDLYSTVSSIGSNNDPPSDWADLCLDNSFYVPSDTTSDTPFLTRWLVAHWQRTWSQVPRPPTSGLRANFTASTTINIKQSYSVRAAIKQHIFRGRPSTKRKSTVPAPTVANHILPLLPSVRQPKFLWVPLRFSSFDWVTLWVRVLIIVSRHCSSDTVEFSADKLVRSTTASQAQKRTQTGASPNTYLHIYMLYISITNSSGIW